MGFAQANRTVFATKYATFSGRAGASEFWWPMLTLVLVSFGLGVLSGYGEPSALATLLPVLLLVAVTIPIIAVTVRRLHDTGRSGWWYLIGFVPLVGGLILIVLILLGPTPGPNQYGPGPGQSWEAGRPTAPPQEPKRPGW